jgi:N-acetyl-alpha-D-muramate 1-phosphate uridylyltransferase
MRAMILAAGRGERMRPLTNNRPKPLLEINGKPLIQYQIEKLVDAGIKEIVINHAVMGGQIEACLGDGRQLGARIQYSAEGNTPLETGGGIFRALPLLGKHPFIAINADIWTDYPLQDLPETLAGLAHLVLVSNPVHHPHGDFAMQNGYISNHGARRYTFSGIGMYSHDLFRQCSNGAFALAPLIRQAAEHGKQVTAEIYNGLWMDIGTPERLQALVKLTEK